MKTSNLLTLAGAVAAAAALQTAAAATSVINFTTAEGFTAGQLNGQNDITAQAGITVDPTGTGIVSSATNGFLRSVFFSGGSDATPATAATRDQVISDLYDPNFQSLTLTLTGLTINRPAGTAPAGVFGLTNTSVSGAAQNVLGVQFRTDGSNVLIDNQAFGAVAPVDTGFDLGQTFETTIAITRDNAGEFTATATVGTATLISGTTSDAGLLGAIFQAQGPSAGTLTFDGVRAESVLTAVPEPSTSLFAGLAGLCALGLRRRK